MNDNPSETTPLEPTGPNAMNLLDEFNELRPDDPTGSANAVTTAKAALAETFAAPQPAAAETTATTSNVVALAPRRHRALAAVGASAAVAAAVLSIGWLSPSSAPDALNNSLGTGTAGAVEVLRETADQQRQRAASADEPVQLPAGTPEIDLEAEATPDEVWNWADTTCEDPDASPFPMDDLSTEQCGLMVVLHSLPIGTPVQQAAMLDAIAQLPEIELDNGPEIGATCTSTGMPAMTQTASFEVERDDLGASFVLYENADTGAVWSMFMIEGDTVPLPPADAAGIGADGQAPIAAVGADGADTSGEIVVTAGGEPVGNPETGPVEINAPGTKEGPETISGSASIPLSEPVDGGSDASTSAPEGVVGGAASISVSAEGSVGDDGRPVPPPGMPATITCKG